MPPIPWPLLISARGGVERSEQFLIKGVEWLAIPKKDRNSTGLVGRSASFRANFAFSLLRLYGDIHVVDSSSGTACFTLTSSNFRGSPGIGSDQGSYSF